MKNIIISIHILITILIIMVVGCSPKTNYCDLPEIKQALRNVLILDLKDWQKNANYAGIENFEEKVNQVIEDLKIIETRYIGGNDFRLSEIYMDQNAPGAVSCRCSSKIRFKDHENYIQQIEAPVAKVKAEEHPTNSAYLRLEEQMNYLDNEGFDFSYVVIKKSNEPIQVIQLYPLVRETNIENAGKLIFEYIKSLN